MQVKNNTDGDEEQFEVEEDEDEEEPEEDVEPRYEDDDFYSYAYAAQDASSPEVKYDAPELDELEAAQVLAFTSVKEATVSDIEDGSYECCDPAVARGEASAPIATAKQLANIAQNQVDNFFTIASTWVSVNASGRPSW